MVQCLVNQVIDCLRVYKMDEIIQNKGRFENAEHFLMHLMEISEMMISAGGEIYRVEDTLNRMGKSYGAEKMSVFAITGSIVVTMVLPGQHELTQSCRINDPGSTDFSVLEDLNELSREYCSGQLSVDELAVRIDRLRKRSYPFWMTLLGSVVAAGASALFFGGDPVDGILAAAGAIIICLTQTVLDKLAPNRVVRQFLCSLACGLFVVAFCRLSPIFHADKVLIGDIMLLIPGVAITNSVRDILYGDTVSGLLRMTESVLWAGALACGFMVSIVVWGIV